MGLYSALSLDLFSTVNLELHRLPLLRHPTAQLTFKRMT